MILAIEGGDAVGKATHSKLLAEKLKGTRFSFPNYETTTGKAIMRHLTNSWCAGSLQYSESFDKPYIRREQPEDALAFQCLQTCNRLEMLSEIQVAHWKGPVVFDRYTASAMVYGSLDGLERDLIEKLNASLPQPNIWILLDVPVEEGFLRRPERRDRYENNRSYLEKVRVAYLRLFEEKQKLGWHVVDGTGSIEEVQHKIAQIMARNGFVL